MNHASSNLLAGEHIEYQSHLHWWIVVGPVLLGALALFLMFGVSDSLGNAIGVLLFFYALVAAVSGSVRYLTSEFVVTNRRLLVKTGFIRPRTLELFLDQVASIGVDQGIWARMVGYGAMTVIGSGGTREPFSYIANPLQFRREVHGRNEPLPH